MTGKKEIGEKTSEVIAMIGQACKTLIIHKNKASNLKSKLSKKANAAA